MTLQRARAANHVHSGLMGGEKSFSLRAQQQSVSGNQNAIDLKKQGLLNTWKNEVAVQNLKSMVKSRS